jgi:hypothetical protein
VFSFINETSFSNEKGLQLTTADPGEKEIQTKNQMSYLQRAAIVPKSSSAFKDGA